MWIYTDASLTRNAGNPTYGSFGGYTVDLEWENGRQLRSLEKNISNGNSFSEIMYNAGRSFLAGFGDGFLNGAKYYVSTACISIGVYPFLGLFNGGAGLIRDNYMVGYQNPNVLGITFYASRIKGEFRVDLDPTHSIHYHYGKTKKLRDIHRGSWIGGIFVGIYSGFTGEIY